MLLGVKFPKIGDLEYRGELVGEFRPRADSQIIKMIRPA